MNQSWCNHCIIKNFDGPLSLEGDHKSLEFTVNERVEIKQHTPTQPMGQGRNHKGTLKINILRQELPWWPSDLRIHLPMQGTWVRSLVRELRCHMETKPVHWRHSAVKKEKSETKENKHNIPKLTGCSKSSAERVIYSCKCLN